MRLPHDRKVQVRVFPEQVWSQYRLLEGVCGFIGEASMSMNTGKVLIEVLQERKRQNQKFKEQNHSPMEWVAILGEEFGEVSKAAVEAHFTGYDSTGNWDEYRMELVQVAAVAVAMIECLDRSRWLEKNNTSCEFSQPSQSTKAP